MTPDPKRPDVVSVYRRILRAADEGRGVRLTWEECVEVSLDSAVQDAVVADEEAPDDT